MEEVGIAATYACLASKALEIDSYSAEREDVAGKFLSAVPVYRGSDLYLDPAGSAGLINRLVVKMRRNDTVVEPDLNVTDKQSLEVLARERFIAPR